MIKVNELLDRTGKVVGSIAAISLGIAIITVSAVTVKENIKELLHLKQGKVCFIKFSKKHTEPQADESAPKNSAPAPKKSSKKSVEKKEESK